MSFYGTVCILYVVSGPLCSTVCMGAAFDMGTCVEGGMVAACKH